MNDWHLFWNLSRAVLLPLPHPEHRAEHRQGVLAVEEDQGAGVALVRALAEALALLAHRPPETAIPGDLTGARLFARSTMGAASGASCAIADRH